MVAPRQIAAVDITSLGIFSAGGRLIGAGPASLRRTTAKLAQATAGQGSAVIVGIGDSIMRGTKSGDGTGGSDATQGYRGVLNQLAALMTGSTLTVNAESVFGYGGYEQAFATYDNRITVTGAFNQGAGGGIQSGGGQIFKAGSAGTWTYAPVQSVNTMDIYYLRNGSSFTYSVDGAAAVTVNPGSAANAITKTTISLGTSGAHSVVVSWVSGTVYLLGANAYNNTGNRVDLLNFGWHGSKTQQWVDGAATPQAWTYDNLISAVNANLVIFALGGTNDLAAGASVATYTANLATLVGKIKALSSPPDILLMTAPPRADVAGYEASIKNYAAAMTAYGAANNIPVYDRGSWYGDAAGAQTLGLLSSDAIHPLRAGYVRDARDLRSILLG